MPTTNGTFARIWRFVDQKKARENILRSDLDLALDDIADGINAVMTYPSRASFLASGAPATKYPVGSLILAGTQTYRVAAPTAMDFHEITTGGSEGAGGLKVYEAGDFFSSLERATSLAADTLGADIITVGGTRYVHDPSGEDLTTGDARKWSLKALIARSGDSAALDSTAGEASELQFDSKAKEIRVYDGTVLGGYKIARAPYASLAELRASPEPSRGVGRVWQTTLAEYVEEPAGSTDFDFATEAGVLLRATPSEGRVWQVDAFGPACDGVTSDAPAIEAALARLEEGDTLRFTPGRTYWVDRMIRRDGVSFTFDYRGATLAVMDDSVWHVFRFSGTVEAPIAWVKVLHGKFDGRMHRQRHWPNQALRTGRSLSDGSADPLNGHVIQYRRNGRFAYHEATNRYYTWSDITGGPEDDIVGRVLTEFTGDPGDFFHANSEINGLTWQDGWMKGSAGDGINPVYSSKSMGAGCVRLKAP
ncbi:hypothetical protein [Salipiger marinus]|uniref:Uncharacterized protein n=1 Tax=Salipiger marinus TaxID=555512 RepID=A0A1G8MS20_9RHOB|nr:hypothetical protein [Salipiger marinus]SDI70666.1 hypothetical protein SAMN04487993_1008230 [Salipiger marinus]